MDTDDYRWFDFVERPLPERFPGEWLWLAGADEWAQGIRALSEMDPAAGTRCLERIRDARRRPAGCPRIFVSHRQADGAAALRLAWLAQDAGWHWTSSIWHPRAGSSPH